MSDKSKKPTLADMFTPDDVHCPRQPRIDPRMMPDDWKPQTDAHTPRAEVEKMAEPPEDETPAEPRSPLPVSRPTTIEEMLIPTIHIHKGKRR